MRRLALLVTLIAVAATLQVQGPETEATPLPSFEVIGAEKIGGTVSPDGKTEIQCDLVESLHRKNVGGSDGAGLCVFTSIMHSARYQHVKVLEDFQDWMKQYPGGGYPDKVKQKIAQVCKERNVPEPAYIQVQGKDLEILKLACRTGRMPAVTYSYGSRYGGSKIAHMVSLPSAGAGEGPDGRGWYVVLDNNFPGANAYAWLSEADFLHTYAAGGQGWAVILLDCGPPPVPHN